MWSIVHTSRGPLGKLAHPAVSLAGMHRRNEMQSDKIEKSARRVVAGLAGGLVLGWGVLCGAWAADTPANLDGVKIVSAEAAIQMQAKGVPLIDTRVATEYADKT